MEELNQHLWKNGFICPKRSHDKSYQLKYRHLHECAKCGHQVSPTAGTVFEHTRLPLPKWFAAIYLMVADKGGISAQRLSKMIDVSWLAAYCQLRSLRQSMKGRDRCYWFEGLVEVDDTFIGGCKSGRGAEGKKLVIFAVEWRESSMVFMIARIVEWVSSEQIQEFASRILLNSEGRTDAFNVL